MATLPANIENQAQQAQNGNNLVTGFSGLSLFRQIGLLVGLAASIAIGFAVVLWSQEPDYSPLLTDVNSADATQAVDVLRGNDIPYKIDTRNGGLLVPSEQLHAARMQLAAVGISDNRSVGYEILDKEQGLGASQFMENISYRRGLEGELARTISSLKSVRSARVHLALPKASVFVRDERKPSASVFVELAAGRQLEEDQSNAIVNLVASSVPQLSSSDVTIVDQNGRLLSEQGRSESAVMAAHQFEYTRKLEQVLTQRVQQILAPVVGLNKFKAEVSADLDFTAVEQTAEVYNPQSTVVRSEQTLDEQRTGTAAATGGVPGALSNQPPAAGTTDVGAIAGQPGAGTPANSRRQSTRNYELDRTISYTKHPQGRVTRLSVAVVVDDLSADGDSPTSWPQEKLDRLTELVRGAVGYDEARGDRVTVVNAAFAPVEKFEPVIEEVAIWEKSWFPKVVKQSLAGILVLLLIFMVIRPIMKSLSNDGAKQKELAIAVANAQAGPAAAQGRAGGNANIPQQFAGAGGAALLPGPGQSYDMQLAAAQGMIADNPQRAAQVIKQWVTENE